MPTPASLISGWALHVGTSRLPAGSGIAVGEERVFSVVKSFKGDSNGSSFITEIMVKQISGEWSSG